MYATILLKETPNSKNNHWEGYFVITILNLVCIFEADEKIPTIIPFTGYSTARHGLGSV
jgi:hypothetical protein